VAHCTGRVLDCTEKLLAFEDCLEDADDQERHHRMRIAAKRLRYTLEISRPLYQGRADEAIGVIKKVQTLLGEVHDCDVWVAHVDAFLAEERRRMAACFGSPRPFARVKPGLIYLRQNRSHARRAVFEELVDYWRALRGQDFWRQLGALVRDEGPEVGATGNGGLPPAKSAKNGNSADPCQDLAAGQVLHSQHATEAAFAGRLALRSVGQPAKEQ
jgi:hypothetical protein